MEGIPVFWGLNEALVLFLLHFFVSSEACPGFGASKSRDESEEEKAGGG